MTSFGIVRRRTASASTPRRLTSEMSSTTSTSASFSARAPMSLESRTSSPSRNLYMSGQGVGLTILERMPIWPRSLASAVSEPHPSPSALMWVDIATERPARSSCARRSIDSLRCCGTLRRSSTAFRASQLRVRPAVSEVDDEANDHPHDQPLPRWARQAAHHVPANQDTKYGNQWYQRCAERTRQIRRLVTKRDDSTADDNEGEQCSDGYQLTKQADWEQSSHHGGHNTRENRRYVGSVEARMHLAECRRQQAVARHRVKHARLSHQHDQHDRSESGYCADVDDRSQPRQRGACLVDCHEHRMRNVKLGVIGETGHHQRHQDIEHGADSE